MLFNPNFSNLHNPFSSWEALLDCCDWFGVTCNDTKNLIISLTVTYHDLNITIPPSLSNLKYLEIPRLQKIPYLVGKIPLQISKLSYFTSVTIRILHLFDLYFNCFYGLIPHSLAKLSFLRAIDFSRNQLTEPILE
ncbi:hypothetical protein MIMGU_mgv1a025408mg, partial [Erythranthe guttata]